VTGYNGTEARVRVGRGDTPPPVFFVRVANTGLRLDAASRMARRGVTGGEVSRLEGLKVGMLKSEEESD
jgi:hypothetical protein